MRELVRYGVKVTGKQQVVAGIYDEKKQTLKIGVSSCHNNDCYNKSIGRSIALGRAKSNKVNVTVHGVAAEGAGKYFRDYAEELFKKNENASCISKWVY